MKVTSTAIVNGLIQDEYGKFGQNFIDDMSIDDQLQLINDYYFSIHPKIHDIDRIDFILQIIGYQSIYNFPERDK